MIILIYFYNYNYNYYYLLFLFFSGFLSEFLSKNAIALENSFFFLLEMNCFNWNEMFLIRIIFVYLNEFF